MPANPRLSVLEICAGAGGQSSGLHQAGFDHALAIEIDSDAAATLRLNSPSWNVATADVREADGRPYRGVDLLAGGVPCPPFSIAGKQLGADDERDLFPEAIRLVREADPAAVMLENVKGLASARFAPYRRSILEALDDLGYDADWQLLNSSDFGVPQLRPRFILVAMKRRYFGGFEWPSKAEATQTVGAVLREQMASRGWAGATDWAERASGIAPTLVGGSRKHGGPDLGPTRARQAWLELGVDGRGLADQAPGPDVPPDHIPRLTNAMAARIQGFDPHWHFHGRKTSVYRQIGNAFPPPVAKAIGTSIAVALGAAGKPMDASQSRLLAVG